MALEKTKLVVEIEANTKGTVKSIEDVSVSISQMEKDTKKTSATTSKSLSEVESKYASLYGQVQKNSSASMAQKDQAITLAEEFYNLNQNIKLMTDALVSGMKISQQFNDNLAGIAQQATATTGAVATMGQETQKQLERESNTVEVAGKKWESFGLSKDVVLGSLVQSAEDSASAIVLAVGSVRALGASFNATGLIAKSVFNPGLLGTIEKTGALIPVLAAVGQALRTTDSEALKVVGTLSVLASLALAGVGIAAGFVLTSIGNLAFSIGTSLFNAVVEAEKLFEKFESTLRTFEFAVKGFGNSFGEEFVGSLDKWNAVLNGLVANTRFSIGEVTKAVKLLIAEGSALGFNFQQNEKILKISADLAAFHGRNIEDVTLAVLSGLTGNSQAVLALGIDLRELALSTTNYVKASGKNIDSMTEQEKVMARFEQIVKKTKPILGATAIDLNTISGISANVAKKIDLLKIKFGEMGTGTRLLLVTQKKLIDSLLGLGDRFIEIVGNVADVGGIFLIATGYIIKHLAIVATLFTAYKVLSTAMIEGSKIHSAFSIASRLLTTALGAQRVAIAANTTAMSIFSGTATAVFSSVKTAIATSVGSNILYLKALGGITGTIRTVLVSAFTSIGAVLMQAGKAVAFLTTKILLSPIFIKAAAMIAAVSLVIDVMDEFITDMKKSVSVFNQVEMASNKTSDSFFSMAKAWASIKQGASSALKGLTEFTKLVLTGAVVAFFEMGKAALYVADKINKGFNIAVKVAHVSINGFIIGMKASFNVLLQLVADSMDKIVKVVYEATGFLGDIDIFQQMGAEADKSLKEIPDNLKKLREQMLDVGDGSGEMTDRFKSAMDLASRSIEEAQNQGMQYGIAMLSAFDDTAMAAEKAAKEYEEVRVTIEGLAAAAASIDVENLKIGVLGDEFQQAIAKATASTIELNKVEETYRNSAEKGAEEIKKVTDARQNSIVAYLELTKKQRDMVKEINDQSKESAVQQLRDSGMLMEAAKKEGDAKIAAFEAQVKGLMELKKWTGESTKGINAARDAILKMNAASIEKAGMEERTKNLEDQKKYWDAQFNAASVVLDLQKQLNELDYKREATLEGQLIAIELQAQMDILKLSNQRKQLELAGALTAELDGQITAIQEAVRASAALGKQELEPVTLKVIFKGAEDLYAKTKAAFKDFDLGDAFKNFDLKKSFQGAADAIKNIDISKIGDDLADMAKDAGNAFVQGIMNMDLGKALSGVGEFLIGAANVLLQAFNPANISALADTIDTNISGLPQALSDAFLKLDAALMKFIDTFPEAFQKILRALPALVQAILDKIPEIINMLGDALISLFDALPNILQRVFDKLPLIFDTLMKKLPDIAASVLKALPLIVNGFVSAVPDMIVAFLMGLPKIVEELVGGLIGAVSEIAVGFVDAMLVRGGLEKIIVALLRAIPRLAVALVKGIVEGLTRAFSAIFKGVKIPAPEMDVSKLGKSLATVMKKVSKEATNAAEELFSVIDLNKVKERRGMVDDVGVENIPAAIDSATATMSSAWLTFLQKLESIWLWVKENIVDPLINGLKEVWMWVYDNILLPLGNFVMTAFQWVIDNILMPLGTFVMTAFQWVIDKVLLPMLGFVATAFQWVIDKVLTPLATFVQVAFQWVIDKVLLPIWGLVTKAFQWVIDNVLTPIWNLVTKAFGWVVENIIKPLGAIGQKAFQWVKDNIIDKLAGVASSIAAIFKPLTDAFTTIIDGINKLVAPLIKVTEAVGSVTGGGGGAGGAISKAYSDTTDFLGFAKGGVVTAARSIPIKGYATGGSVDDRLIATQGGEFVMRRAAVQGVGLGAMNSINQTGSLPQGGAVENKVTIESGAIQINGAGRGAQDIADEVIAKIKRRSLDGEFILSNNGLRTT